MLRQNEEHVRSRESPVEDDVEKQLQSLVKGMQIEILLLKLNRCWAEYHRFEDGGDFWRDVLDE